MVPFFAQWNLSMFSQWIQGWFVWISLINCSHLNYWCSSVKHAFPMTDGLCSQVIFPLCYSSISSSFSSPFQHFYSKVAKGFPLCAFHFLTHPFPLPYHLPCVFYLQPPILVHPFWHFYIYVVSWNYFSLLLCSLLFSSIGSFPCPLYFLLPSPCPSLLTLLPFYWHFCSLFLGQRVVYFLVLKMNFSMPFIRGIGACSFWNSFFLLPNLLLNKSFTQPGNQLLTQ